MVEGDDSSILEESRGERKPVHAINLSDEGASLLCYAAIASSRSP
jgi:hypothetical protein